VIGNNSKTNNNLALRFILSLFSPRGDARTGDDDNCDDDERLTVAV
jgi:hypothetical protein